MRPRVVGIGELLWDLLPGGRQLGGAPANFACHAHALGADAGVVSRVGRDADGDALLRRIRELGLPADGIEVDPDAPTGTVSVDVSDDGQPRYTIHEGVAWDRIAGSEAGRALAASADALCFGSLCQRSEPSRSGVQGLVASARPGALRVFDINLRQHFHGRAVVEASLALADVLKVNDGELPVLASMFGLRGDAPEQMARLAAEFGLRAVALTRGARGSLLWSAGHWSDHPGVAVRVVDTVGAGDAFTAAMTLGLLKGWDPDRVNRLANAVAAHVASCAGATPPLPGHLREAFVDASPDSPGS